MSDYPDSGALFKADEAKKAANPKWPDYEGSAVVDGVELWISAWIKEGKRGKFMSLSFRRKDAPKQQRAATKDERGDLSPDADTPF